MAITVGAGGGGDGLPDNPLAGTSFRVQACWGGRIRVLV